MFDADHPATGSIFHAAQQYGARFIVRGGKESPGFPSSSRFEVMHGSLKDRHVVLEFDSYKTALDCYNSPEYQNAAKFRDQGGQVDVIVIEGFEPAT